MRQWNSHMQAVAQTAGGIGGMGAQEALGKPPLLCQADMVHYLDVHGWWDVAECECCFDQVVSLGAERALTMQSVLSPCRACSHHAERALTMQSLDLFRSLLHTPQPRSTPLAHLNVLEYSFQVPAFGKREDDEEPLAQFMCKCTLAPFVCAEVMILEWMAEPRVGVLMDLGKIRSRLPAILAIPAASALPVAAVHSAVWTYCWRCSSCWAACRRAHGGGEETANMVEVKGVASGCGRDRKDLKWREHLKGRVWERYVDGMASILEHGGGEERDFALAVASVFSRPEHRKLGAMFFAGSTTTTSIVEDAAVTEARGRLSTLRLATEMKGGGAAGMKGRGTTGGKPGTAAAVAPTTGRPACKAAATSARARPNLGSSSTGSCATSNSCTRGSRETCLVPVNTDHVLHVLGEVEGGLHLGEVEGGLHLGEVEGGLHLGDVEGGLHLGEVE
ncbi:unnamed protein product, partial [Closterium sp. NIES-53]